MQVQGGEKKGRPEPPHNPSSGEIDAPEKTRRKMVLVGKVPLPPVLISRPSVTDHIIVSHPTTQQLCVPTLVVD
jgi:hypothetical protein